MLPKTAMTLLLSLVLSFQFSATEFRIQTLLGGKASISLPADLQIMPGHLKEIKYPTPNPPQEVFSDDRGTVNVTATIRPYPGDLPLSTLAGAMAVNLNKSGKIKKWGMTGPRQIAGREFMAMEFIAPAFDTDIYNFMYFTKRGDELVVFSVNCSVGLLEEWRSKFGAIIESSRIVES